MNHRRIGRVRHWRIVYRSLERLTNFTPVHRLGGVFFWERLNSLPRLCIIRVLIWFRTWYRYRIGPVRRVTQVLFRVEFCGQVVEFWQLGLETQVRDVVTGVMTSNSGTFRFFSVKMSGLSMRDMEMLSVLSLFDEVVWLAKNIAHPIWLNSNR